LPYRVTAVDGEDEDTADTLRELQERCFGDTAPLVPSDKGWWWIASDGRELAGFCLLVPTSYNPAMGYLKRAGVLRPHRGQGLQRRFVRVRETKARKVGMLAMITDTTDNPSSANNLIACGYRLFTPDNPWGFAHTIYWRKDL
jgi:GNAT superfamily N-acetyltransferase